MNRAWLLGVAATGLLAGPAVAVAAPPCPQPQTVEALRDQAELGEQAFAAMDLDAIHQAQQAALAIIPCLAEPVSALDAASFHRMMAMTAFTTGDEDQVLAEFHAARRLHPGYEIPARVAPADHPLVALYERAVDATEGSLDPTIPPEDGWVTVDGVRDAPRPTGISVLVQVWEADGALSESRFLVPGDPTPAWGPLPLDRLRRKRRRTAWLGATGTSAVVAGGLYGAAWAANARFYDTTDPLGDAELLDWQTRTNALTWGAVGMGVVTVALGTVTVVTW